MRRWGCGGGVMVTVRVGQRATVMEKKTCVCGHS